MTAELRNLHLQLLSRVATAKGRWRGSPLTSFAAMHGAGGSKGLMVVGRAVNGWTHKWHAQDAADAAKRETIVGRAFEPMAWNNNQPMLWVSDRWGTANGYNTRKSAFWRVIHDTVRDLGIANVAERAWPTAISWSNLYKVAPFDGGNPSSSLSRAQHAICIDILRMEIETWSPQRVLFLTGASWAKSFLSGLGFAPDPVSPVKPVEASGTLFNGARAVVVPHPQAKSEASLVAATVKAFGGV